MESKDDNAHGVIGRQASDAPIVGSPIGSFKSRISPFTTSISENEKEVEVQVAEVTGLESLEPDPPHLGITNAILRGGIHRASINLQSKKDGGGE